MHDQLETFLALAEASDRVIPRFVERELRAYLECGLLPFGFIRVRCTQCGFDRLVAFSCKGRGFCPSCVGRRRVDTAAPLVDRVLPRVPGRQWVLSLPWALRYRLAYDRKLCNDILALFIRTLFGALRRRAPGSSGRQMPAAQYGAVTFVQRFGDALNSHLHFHTLMLDGVYIDDGRGGLRFQPLPGPSDAEIERTTRTLAKRLQRLLQPRCHGSLRLVRDGDSFVMETTRILQRPVKGDAYTRGIICSKNTAITMKEFVMGGWKSSIGTLLCAGALLVVGSAGASEKPVAEKILDILKANGQISQEQYDDLSRQTKEEAKTQPAAKHHGKGVPLEMSWNKGLRLTDPDGNFKFKIGGRIMNDWAWFNKSGDIQNTKGDFGDGTEFRRARLYLAGTVNDRIGFKAQYDFAGGDADFKDVYIELKKVPYLGHIRVGHFKEAYSLEELTSSKYITFMERSIADVAPGRNTGIGFYNSIGKAKRATWAVGAFREAGGYGNSSDENAYNVTGRVTGLPWYEDRGAKLLHLGFSYSHKFGDASTHQLEQKPEAHMAKALIDTGTLLFDDIDLLTPEVVLVLGPFSLQGEYTMTSVSRARGSADVDFDSYYVEASYFLTGEHREYKTSAGAFSRVPPKTNFGKNGGCGAWQLAVRYSAADYNDADIAGGKLENVTVGLNWHLNPNARLMFNYTNSNLNNVGDVDIAQMRFQIDF